MDEQRRKLMVDADEEITRICGGETEYLEWLRQNAAGVGLVIADTGTQLLSKAAELLPFPVLETLVGMFVAAHRHAHTMWVHRDELNLLSHPTPGRPV